MASGVDSAVASTHKVLGSLTQAAILNVRGTLVDPDRVRTTVGMAQTTSPSVLILASIDATRRQMALHGPELLDRAITLAETRAAGSRSFRVSRCSTPSALASINRLDQARHRCRRAGHHRL